MPQANSFINYPDFFIRTPIFPLDYIEEIPDESGDLLVFLRKQWENPIIRDAIIFASPTLFDQLNEELRNIKN